MFPCSFCGYERRNNRSRAQHERFCNRNPSHVRPPSFEAEARIKLSKASTGRYHSEASKRLISEKLKLFFKEHPDQVPYRRNHKSKGPSFPERFWLEALTNAGLSPEVQYQFESFSLDFAFPHLKVDLEIDGNQHLIDPSIRKHDERRNLQLNQAGWRVIRVVWSRFQRKKSKEEREEFVQLILKEIETGTSPLVILPAKIPHQDP